MHKKLFFNFILIGTTAIIGLIFGEIYLQLNLKPLLKRKLPEIKYETHPVRRFTLKANQKAYTYGVPANINKNGFRSNGSISINNGIVVLGLGDSFTFGLGVEDRQTWPAKLENYLNKSNNKKYSVINAGTISYGIFQEMDILKEKGLILNPNVIIHALYWNDYMNPEPPKPDEPTRLTNEGYFIWDKINEKKDLLQSFKKWVFENLMVAVKFRDFINNFRGPLAETSSYGVEYSKLLSNKLTAVDLDPVSKFYDDLLELQKQNNFEILVIILPVVDLVGKKVEINSYQNIIRKMLDDRKIKYLDCFELWEDQGFGTELFLREEKDAHLNSEGYDIIAGAIKENFFN
jgi:lysophospholipase L1-like esterase